MVLSSRLSIIIHILLVFVAIEAGILCKSEFEGDSFAQNPNGQQHPAAGQRGQRAQKGSGEQGEQRGQGGHSHSSSTQPQAKGGKFQSSLPRGTIFFVPDNALVFRKPRSAPAVPWKTLPLPKDGQLIIPDLPDQKLLQLPTYKIIIHRSISLASISQAIVTYSDFPPNSTFDVGLYYYASESLNLVGSWRITTGTNGSTSHKLNQYVQFSNRGDYVLIICGAQVCEVKEREGKPTIEAWFSKFTVVP